MLFPHRRNVAFLLLFLMACCGRATDSQRFDSQSPNLAITDSALQQRALAAADGFQGAFLISRGGKVLAASGAGLANRISQAKNGLHTSLRIASCTKPITAVAIMRLVDEGVMSVDAPVSNYLPDFGENGSQILIRHLLSHSSGLANYTDWLDLADSPEQIIASLKTRPLKFTPGTKFQYSNSNYALLGYLVARMTFVPYDRHLQDQFFIPLGMQNSGFDFPRVPGSGFAAGCGGDPNCAFEDNVTAYSSGALYASVADLFYFYDALYKGRLVKPETLKLMETKASSEWGLGFKVDGNGWVSHNGEVSGFTSQIHSHSASQTFVVVLANGSTDAWTLAKKLKAFVD